MNKKLLLSTILIFQFTLITAQTAALKTNLLYDATSTINLGLEFKLKSNWTLDLSGNVNLWTFSGNKKMKLWLVQPEARWWTCHQFSGHFLGAHFHGGQFNMGGMLPWGFTNGKMFGRFGGQAAIMDNRYQGWLTGAGLSYGYHWILGKRWGLEATLGVGYAYIKYEKYPCTECGSKLADEKKNYFGPTKAGISLIYMIK